MVCLASNRPEPPPPPPPKVSRAKSESANDLPLKHQKGELVHSRDRRVSFDTRELSFDTTGRDNVFWHPESGLLIYSILNKVKMEDLATRAKVCYQQNDLDISLITVSADAEVVAAAHVGTTTHAADISLWIFDKDEMCFHGSALSGHPIGVQDMSISQDNKYLVSVGTHRDGMINVWEIATQSLRWTSKLPMITHAVTWVDDFPVSVGANGNVTKWELKADDHEAKAKSFCIIDPSKQDVAHHNTCIARPADWFADMFKAEKVVGITDNKGVCRVVSLVAEQVLVEWKAIPSAKEISAFCWHDKYMVFAAGDQVVAWDVGKGLPAEEEILKPVSAMSFSAQVTSMSWESLGKEGVVAVADGNIWYTNVEKYTSMLLNPEKSTTTAGPPA